MNNQIIVEDFEKIIHSGFPFEDFKKKVFLITGGTGLIGSLCAKALLFANEELSLGLSVIVTIRDEQKYKLVYSDYTDNTALSFLKWSLEDEINTDNEVDYIIHTAAVTNSRLMVSNPLSVINLSLDGTRKVFDFACRKNSTVVYVSSMEMYGNPNLDRMVTEEDQGYIDLTNPRSCYPESKRMCECLCTAYASQMGLHVRTARLAQTFGAGIFPSENRVFAQFAKSACKGENIILHTKGKSEGDYVYTADAVKALLTILIFGEDGQAYNVANEESHTTIAEMAQMVADELSNGRSKVVFDIPQSNTFGYAPDTKLFLSSKKLRSLGWNSEIGLKEAYRRMIDYMADEWK